MNNVLLYCNGTRCVAPTVETSALQGEAAAGLCSRRKAFLVSRLAGISRLLCISSLVIKTVYTHAAPKRILLGEE